MALTTLRLMSRIQVNPIYFFQLICFEFLTLSTFLVFSASVHPHIINEQKSRWMSESVEISLHSTLYTHIVGVLSQHQKPISLTLTPIIIRLSTLTLLFSFFVGLSKAITCSNTCYLPSCKNGGS